MHETIAAGLSPGLLACIDGEAFAWVAVAERTTMPVLDRARIPRSPDDRVSWVITCFFVRADQRGAGWMARGIEVATEAARAAGVDLLKAWPAVDAGFDGCQNYQGVLSSFERAGWSAVSRPSARRAHVRLPLAD